MSTSLEFIEYACEQINGVGEVRYRKMFGEFMIYVNNKPILLICDDTVFVKMREEIAELMADAETGFPYEGAKEHYILNIDNSEVAKEAIRILEPITPLPKSRKKK